MNVTQVDRDVAYAGMVLHVCCKRLFLMFYLFFRRMLQECLFGCCICFAMVFNRFCKCFRCMFQVFYTDVAKVDQDVAYVAMVVHVCCRRLFLMFYLFFRCMLQVCLSGCCRTGSAESTSQIYITQVCLSRYCICFTHMLQVFYLDVAYVCNGFLVFSGVFASVSLSSFVCCNNCLRMF